MSIRSNELSHPLSLHDSLALGEVELGLMAQKHEQSEMEEMERLPVLLRLLSSSRPLSSVPEFPKKGKDPEGLSPTSAALIDEVANQVVARLEDVAATYSVAEGVDVVACHLAPSICKNLSKLSPLKRKRSSVVSSDAANLGSSAGSSNSAAKNTGWETSELAVVGANPRSSFKRRRVSQQSPTTSQQSKHSDGLHEGAASEGVSSDEENANPSSSALPQSKRRSSRRSSDSREAGKQDLQEEVVAKTLSDLSALVVASLEPVKPESDMDGGDTQRGKLSLKLEDSALSEPARSHVAAGNVGVMAGSDLGSTVVSLCHFAPVFRQQHVANALCRATIPQTAGLVKRMGANCPAGVPTLLRGCIEAWKSATVMGSRYASIAKMAKSAVKSLASLSDREASRIRTVLQQESVMVDLQLQLAIKQDPTVAICLLIQHLSYPSSAKPGEKQNGPEPLVKTPSYSASGIQNSSTQATDPCLLTHLQATPTLLVDTLNFLKKELTSIIKIDSLSHESGRLCLLFRCYTWLVLQCDLTTVLTSEACGMKPLELFLTVVMEVVNKSQKGPTGSWETVLLGLIFSSSMLTLGRLLAFEQVEPSILKVCQSCLEASFDRRGSAASERVSASFQRNDVEELLGLVNDYLEPGLRAEQLMIETPDNLLQEGLLKVCEWAQGVESLGSSVKADPSSCPLTEVSTLLDRALKDSAKEAVGLDTKQPVSESATEDAADSGNAVEDGADGNTEKANTTEKHAETTETIKICLTRILSEERSDGTGLYDEMIPELIIKATSYLERNSALKLPLVSPLQLEINAGKAKLTPGCPVDEAFLYQVLYWFAYIDSASSSFVRFDVRVLPLKEVLTYCQWLSGESVWARPLQIQIECNIWKRCPEVQIQRKRWEVTSQVRCNNRRLEGRKALLGGLSESLKASLTNDNQAWAAAAEANFLLARANLRDSDVFPCVASTLLATPNSPPPFCTYAMLCHDPLVFLKSPMRVWQTVGLRRILLTILSSLLETNEAILFEESPSASSAEEVISSRNLIAVRCVLAVVSGSDSNPEHTAHACSMTTHFIRKLMAKGGGLVGMLVKQGPGLPDSVIDWVVEFVPETMADSKSLVNVFERGSSVTTRLSASAAIIRFAIAHGHQQEDVTDKLVYAALTQLVSSFFLVVGPVGVPVNVLVGEDSGVDVAQLRSSTFRVLKSLLGVRGRMRPALRTECGLALNKLAGLCKGENLLSGLSGAVVSRRKALLRDMYDHVAKAANSMAVTDGVSSNLA
ncbi:expressed unknown protein [Seminavis robusta]|uniref:Uncharacterized protein n=1 Tax=Seminavis robusta TaxID=568900 RepID=A0A9N8EF55_9STRA|nr:expressed unknown protein [Seminavis robusta]|eukprot:Sro987_g228240.1 n/a (1264) ;mRNA; f:12317-16192